MQRMANTGEGRRRLSARERERVCESRLGTHREREREVGEFSISSSCVRFVSVGRVSGG